MNTNQYIPNNGVICHYGVPGMRWGVRKGSQEQVNTDPRIRRTLKGNLHRLAAANYNLNAKTYSKMGNNTLASMNRAAATSSQKKADAADRAAYERRQARKNDRARQFRRYGKAKVVFGKPSMPLN